MKILICIGTRPEHIKIKPLLKEFKKNNILYKICFTGQHEDLCKDVERDFTLEYSKITNNRLNDITSTVLTFSPNENFTHVLVQGDTTSALAMAIWAFNKKIKIIHLEAGLRTYDNNNPYPEELNRQLISRIADINLCPTLSNKENILAEKCMGEVYVVGNTVIDNLSNIKPSYTNKILITLHRRENHLIMDQWFSKINNLAKQHTDFNFILPMHPNPNVLKHSHLLTHVNVTKPLEYKELINILKDCKFVITDSGGIQEEASFLNKKIIICRKTTERVECLHSGHGVLCQEPSELPAIFQNIQKDFVINAECPFGDGAASKKIVNILVGK